jgi:hypothetical protein
MPSSNPWRRREPEHFAADSRPDADTFVYCKGCGEPLESRSRVSQPRAVITFMMCSSCRETHGHALMPGPGSPTFCYRCGGSDELYVTGGISPATYHVCPRCVPDRAARYRAHDFEVPQPVPVVPAAES